MSKKTNKFLFKVTSLVLSFIIVLSFGIEVNAGSSSTPVATSKPISDDSDFPCPKGQYVPGSVYGPRLSQDKLNELKAKVQEIIAVTITSDMTEFQKVVALRKYILNNFKYAKDWSVNSANTAWGALVYGEAQCSGWARSFKALCDAAGIYCFYVRENTDSDGAHQWNIVKVENNWYIVDVTTLDALTANSLFLISDEEYKKQGFSWDTSKYPACPTNYKLKNRPSAEMKTFRSPAEAEAYFKAITTFNPIPAQ